MKYLIELFGAKWCEETRFNGLEGWVGDLYGEG